MEKMIKIIGSIGRDGFITLLINDKTIKLDKEGNGEINQDDLISGGDRSLYVYDTILNEHINRQQKIDLYYLFIENNKTGIKDVVDMLGIDKDEARLICVLGMRNKILIKKDSQWKCVSDKKEQLKQLVKNFERDKEKEENVSENPFKHTSVYEQCPTKTMAEIGINPVDVKQKKK